MSLRLQPVRVATGDGEDGLLVFADHERLVAVLTQLSEQHEELAGRWFLEAGFGRLAGPSHPTFADLDAAHDWINRRLAGELMRRNRPRGDLA